MLSEVDFCRLCRFGFRDKQRKRNVVGEFTKMFEKVVGVKVLEGDKRAVCDTCRYRGRGIVGRLGCLCRYFVVTKTLQEVNALKEIPREKRPRNRDTSQRSNFSS